MWKQCAVPLRVGKGKNVKMITENSSKEFQEKLRRGELGKNHRGEEVRGVWMNDQHECVWVQLWIILEKIRKLVDGLCDFWRAVREFGCWAALHRRSREPMDVVHHTGGTC